MNRRLLILLGTIAITGLLGVSVAQQPPQQGELPPGHPSTQPPLPPGHPPTQPPLPPGHPPLEEQTVQQPGPAVEADPADVESIEAIVEAYYDSISGPAGEPRDWERFRSLLLPDARFVTLRGSGAQATAFTLTADDYVQMNRTYFEKGGYFEHELFRRIDTFGRIAQVFSTYASRRKAEDPAPYSRGINSLQLIELGGRWWIVSVMWDYERPAENPLPEQYLPAE